MSLKQIELETLNESRASFKKCMEPFLNKVSNQHNPYREYVDSLFENPFSVKIIKKSVYGEPYSYIKLDMNTILEYCDFLNKENVLSSFRDYRKMYLMYHDLELIDVV